jgi:hypothetical protein
VPARLPDVSLQPLDAALKSAATASALLRAQVLIVAAAQRTQPGLAYAPADGHLPACLPFELQVLLRAPPAPPGPDFVLFDQFWVGTGGRELPPPGQGVLRWQCTDCCKCTDFC